MSDRLSAPILPQVGVIGLVPEAWGDVWMPRHHVMTRLARYFRVAWVDPAPEWRQLFRPRDKGPLLNAEVPEAPGFEIERLSLFPRLHRPRAAADLSRVLRLRRVAQHLKRKGVDHVLLYIWRPEFGYALDALPHAAGSCYHVDDEYSFSTTDVPTAPKELDILQRADHVILHSPGLWEKKAHLASNPVSIPNGVDYRAYCTPTVEPADLQGIPRPRIGYTGVIKRFLDMHLLHELVLRRPDWSFVLVGPVRPLGIDSATFERLSSRPNVHLLGPKPVQDLPAYVQHFDVGIMPYDVDEYTKYVYPLKLHEYLAAGIPVVGSRIRTLLDFGGTIQLPHDADEWCSALEEALEPSSKAQEHVVQRRAVARQYDWNVITHRIAALLAQGLGDRLPGGAERVAREAIE